MKWKLRRGKGTNKGGKMRHFKRFDDLKKKRQHAGLKQNVKPGRNNWAGELNANQKGKRKISAL